MVSHKKTKTLDKRKNIKTTMTVNHKRNNIKTTNQFISQFNSGITENFPVPLIASTENTDSIEFASRVVFHSSFNLSFTLPEFQKPEEFNNLQHTHTTI